MERQKIYAYIDESGQDTKGEFFVVAVVVLEEDRDFILRSLEKIEQKSGKKNMKWHKTKTEFKEKYFREILNDNTFKNTTFFNTFTNTKQYIEMTSYAGARAILKKVGKNDYRATVYIDGFNKKEIDKFTRVLKSFQIKRRKVVGVKKEENNAFIRLADAWCGLVRDAKMDNNEWAIKSLRALKKRGVATRL